MSTLRSALDELRDEDLSTFDDAALVDDLDEIERAGRVLEAERSRRLVEFERRSAFGVDGHLSVTAWLVDRHRVSGPVAAGQVRLARSLASMPAVAEALGSGDVSPSAVGVLVSAKDAVPEAFARSGHSLLEAARTLPIDHLKSTVASWRQSVDPQGAAEETERRFERRSLHIAPSLDGMVRVGGELDPETGQTVIRPCGRCRTPRCAPEPTCGHPLSAGPMRSGSSVVGGWIVRTARSSPVSAHTWW